MSLGRIVGKHLGSLLAHPMGGAVVAGVAVDVIGRSGLTQVAYDGAARVGGVLLGAGRSLLGYQPAAANDAPALGAAPAAPPPPASPPPAAARPASPPPAAARPAAPPPAAARPASPPPATRPAARPAAAPPPPLNVGCACQKGAVAGAKRAPGVGTTSEISNLSINSQGGSAPTTYVAPPPPPPPPGTPSPATPPAPIITSAPNINDPRYYSDGDPYNKSAFDAQSYFADLETYHQDAGLVRAGERREGAAANQQLAALQSRALQVVQQVQSSARAKLAELEGELRQSQTDGERAVRQAHHQLYAAQLRNAQQAEAALAAEQANPTNAGSLVAQQIVQAATGNDPSPLVSAIAAMAATQKAQQVTQSANQAAVQAAESAATGQPVQTAPATQLVVGPDGQPYTLPYGAPLPPGAQPIITEPDGQQYVEGDGQEEDDDDFDYGGGGGGVAGTGEETLSDILRDIFPGQASSVGGCLTGTCLG